MHQGHYISMNTVMLSFVMLNKVISIIYCCAAILYINHESWLVVGFCPHVGSTGVFGINLSTLYPSFGSLKEVFSIANQAIGI